MLFGGEVKTERKRAPLWRRSDCGAQLRLSRSMRNGLGDVHTAAAQAAGDPLGGVLLCHCMVGDADAVYKIDDEGYLIDKQKNSYVLDEDGLPRNKRKELEARRGRQKAREEKAAKKLNPAFPVRSSFALSFPLFPSDKRKHSEFREQSKTQLPVAMFEAEKRRQGAPGPDRAGSTAAGAADGARRPGARRRARARAIEGQVLCRTFVRPELTLDLALFETAPESHRRHGCRGPIRRVRLPDAGVHAIS